MNATTAPPARRPAAFKRVAAPESFRAGAPLQAGQAAAHRQGPAGDFGVFSYLR